MQSLNLLGKQAVVAMHFYDSLTLRGKASSAFWLMLVNSKNDSDSVLCDVIIIYLNKWLEHFEEIKDNHRGSSAAFEGSHSEKRKSFLCTE